MRSKIPTREAWHPLSVQQWRYPHGCQRGGFSSDGQQALTELSTNVGHKTIINSFTTKT